MTKTGGDPLTDAAGSPGAGPVGTAGPKAGWPEGIGQEPVGGSSAPPARRRRYRGRHLADAPPPSLARSIIEWILVLGGALLVALVIRNFVFTTFWIPSPSMQPTLIGEQAANGRHDRVVVNRLSYRFGDVGRGDIVVFTTPAGQTPVTEDGREIKDLIKRVVGLGGETVTLREGEVFVDGKELEEDYLPEGTVTDPISAGICPVKQSEFVIPEGSVLVMGDNRTNSQDGRCFGPIKESTILGRAFVRIWPLSEMTWL